MQWFDPRLISDDVCSFLDQGAPWAQEVEISALKAWKLAGHPQVGWWVKVCDHTLNFEGRALETDRYPHSLDSKLPPTHKMKNRACYKQLFHGQAQVTGPYRTRMEKG